MSKLVVDSAHREHPKAQRASAPTDRVAQRWLRPTRLGQAPWLLLALGLVVGCSPAEIVGHRVTVAAPTTYPAPGALRHSGRLWIELREETPDTQCVRAPQHQPLCFQAVRAATASQLIRVLTPSFADVRVRQRGDALKPGDYLLRVRITLNVVAPGSEVGWGAVARASWQLVRDGFNVSSERVRSHGRRDFAYGAGLGQGAGEVVAAITSHIGERLGQLPERRPTFPAPDLPPVFTEADDAPQAEPGVTARR